VSEVESRLRDKTGKAAQRRGRGEVAQAQRGNKQPWTLCDTGYKEATHTKGGREGKPDFKPPRD